LGTRDWGLGVGDVETANGTDDRTMLAALFFLERVNDPASALIYAT
jgi:hypothetical protein